MITAPGGWVVALSVPADGLPGFEAALAPLGGALTLGLADEAGGVPVQVYLNGRPDPARVTAQLAAAAAAAGLAVPDFEIAPLPDERIADFLAFAETMCLDALTRDESCGVHFREEHQTPDGEALRDDARFAHVAVWEWRGADESPERHEEPLVFEEIEPTARSYK